MYEPLTIKKVSQKYNKDDEYYLFGQFLDDFKNENEDRYALIEEEPVIRDDMRLFSCVLAATAHKLANDSGLPVPEWAANEKYVLDSAYYAFNTAIEDFKRHLERTTPVEFTQRNLFMGDNVLSRA